MISSKEKYLVRANAEMELEIAKLHLKKAQNKLKLIDEMDKRTQKKEVKIGRLV